MHEAKIQLFCCGLKGEALFFLLIYCKFRYSFTKIFWGPCSKTLALAGKPAGKEL